MAIFPNIALAILAGGKAKRMGGRNKALLELEGQTFISRIYQNLEFLFPEVLIISNGENDFGIQDVLIYPDIMQSIGPLGGIHSALKNSKKPFVFVVSCDMPFIDASIASILIDEFQKIKPEIIIPTFDNYQEPLFAVYSKSLIQKIESLQTEPKGRPITDLLKISNTKYFDLPDNTKTRRCFTNINSLEDLEDMANF